MAAWDTRTVRTNVFQHSSAICPRPLSWCFCLANSMHSMGAMRSMLAHVDVSIECIHSCFVFPFVQVSTGGYHTGVMTSDGEVHVWGHGGVGQLGLGERDHQMAPVLLSCERFGGGKASMISCGSYHSALVTRDGCVWTFGTCSWVAILVCQFSTPFAGEVRNIPVYGTADTL